jgi:transcriptional regulator with XRE-family HTH domain
MNGSEVRATLGRNIKTLRSRRNWSQANLADKSGLSVVYLSDVERGNKWPYLYTLVKLADAFKIEVYELLKPEDIQPPSTTSFLIRYNEEITAILDKSFELARKQSSQALTKMQKHYKKKFMLS